MAIRHRQHAQEIHRQHAQETPTVEPSTAQGRVTTLRPGAPMALPEALLQEAAAAAPGRAPTLVPPTEAEIAAAEGEGIAAWHTGVKIVALWSNEANRNAFISVPGLGWKKLSAANDSSVVSMAMLAAHAEQTNANVNIRIEADGMVHEIYVW
jgi:hypothetical protein